jgi:hypothetical protein
VVCQAHSRRAIFPFHAPHNGKRCQKPTVPIRSAQFRRLAAMDRRQTLHVTRAGSWLSRAVCLAERPQPVRRLDLRSQWIVLTLMLPPHLSIISTARTRPRGVPDPEAWTLICPRRAKRIYLILIVIIRSLLRRIRNWAPLGRCLLLLLPLRSGFFLRLDIMLLLILVQPRLLQPPHRIFL